MNRTRSLDYDIEELEALDPKLKEHYIEGEENTKQL